MLPTFGGRGGLETKFPWWRLKPGHLSLRAEVMPGGGKFSAEVPEGYGETGFVPSALNWSAPGCWRVVGTIDELHPLTFVVWVQEFPSR